MLPMPGHRYRISIAEEDGMKAGRTWTRGGKRRQAETLGVCIGGNSFDERDRQTIQQRRKSHKYPVEQAVSAVRFV